MQIQHLFSLMQADLTQGKNYTVKNFMLVLISEK